MENCKLVTCFLNLKPGPMSREDENSAEQIKQKLEFKKENLKLLNSFYLPLLSGMALLVVKAGPVSSWNNAMYFFAGLIFLGFIHLKRKKVLREIDSLIKKL